MKKAQAAGQVIGYTRVSTDKQDADRQRLDILTFCQRKGWALSRVETETASGAKDRPVLMETLETLGQGDTLLVTEFSRLSRRGIPEVLEMARAITAKGATLMETTSGLGYDASATGELMMALTATFDRMERERIGERTRSALRARKAAGMKLGRPVGQGKKVEAAMTEKGVSLDMVERMLAAGTSAAALAKLLGLDARTVLRWAKAREGAKV